MLSYLRWQFGVAPAWLARTMWNLELALLQFFSVSMMLRTLFSHWHKDFVPYQRGSFSQMFLSFAWNQISRAIGFVVRSSVLGAWLLVQIPYVIIALGVWAAFIAAPFAIVAGFVFGFRLLL